MNGKGDSLLAWLVAFPLNGGVDIVMFPLFPRPAVIVCPGNLDSVQVSEVVVLSSSSVQVVSAVPLLEVVGWPVTLALVPGLPPLSPLGKDEYSSSQVEELSAPLPLGAVPVPVPVPVTTGTEEFVNHGRL